MPHAACHHPRKRRRNHLWAPRSRSVCDPGRGLALSFTRYALHFVARHDHPARTFAIVARDAPVAVVFRRGPTRHVRLLRWDLRSDVIEPGQWLVGSVDPGPCGVSPNGELLVYEARKGERTFTAVSRPPYFTALAFWSYAAPWTGGGFFADDRTLVLGMRLADPVGSLPARLEVTDAWTWFGMNDRHRGHVSFGDVVWKEPAAHHGWLRTGGTDRKPCPGRSRRWLERRLRGRTRSYDVIDEDDLNSTETLGVRDWADWAPDGSLLFGSGGRLHRRREGQEPVVIADLTPQTFENVEPPPDALRWPRRIAEGQ
jgi:hypothetical protein